MEDNKPLPLNVNTIIAIGASAGSLLVIYEIISQLPNNFKLQILYSATYDINLRLQSSIYCAMVIPIRVFLCKEAV